MEWSRVLEKIRSNDEHELVLGHNMDWKQATELAKCMKNNTSVVRLDLYNNRFGPDGVVALAHMLRFNTTLTHLDVGLNEICLDGATALSKALVVNETLKTLHMSACNSMETKGVRHFFRRLKKNKSLTLLDVSLCGVDGDSASYVADLLKAPHPKLQCLILRNNFLKDEGVKMVVEGIVANSTLTSLDVSLCRFGNEALRILCENLHCVSQLSVEDNDLDVESAKIIANCALKKGKLKSLSVASNCLGSEGTEIICQSLMDNRTLTHLNLNCNAIGAHGVVSVCRMIRRDDNATTMRSLTLAANKIPSEATSIVAKELIMGRNALRHLDVSSNAFKAEDTLSMCECLPYNFTLKTLNLLNSYPLQSVYDKVRCHVEHNGSLTRLLLIGVDVSHIERRNQHMHQMMRQRVALVLCIRKPNVPKEVFQMIARTLWMTKSDVSTFIF